MRKRQFFKQKKENDFTVSLAEKRNVHENFSFMKCSITGHGKELKCTGFFQPLDDVGKYKVRIQKKPGFSPRVEILEPRIEPNAKIHMYSNGNLCLYYPPETPWTSTCTISTHTIPWINEWIVYYELYQITGKWEGPEAPHAQNMKIKQ